jgi:hypothetical protein
MSKIILTLLEKNPTLFFLSLVIISILICYLAYKGVKIEIPGLSISPGK